MPSYLSPGVYVEEVDRGSKPIEGVGTAVAAFVGFTARPPDDDPTDPDGRRPRRVTNWAQFERLYGGFVDGALLPMSVYGYFNNGGGSCYICRIPHISGGRSTPIASLVSAAREALTTLEVVALDEQASIEVVIEWGASEDEQPPTTFTLRVRGDGQEVESFSDLTFGQGLRNVAAVVNEESRHIRVKVHPAKGVPLAERLPTQGTFRLETESAAHIDVTDSDLLGSETDRTGVQGLVIAEDVTMVACPDLFTAASANGEFDLGMFASVQRKMANYCSLAKDRVAVLDAPPGMGPEEVAEWRSGTGRYGANGPLRDAAGTYDSKYAALYYPWLQIRNPLYRPGSDSRKMLTIPPSGHVAGIWARNDGSRGVWKAPANEVVRGADDLEAIVTNGEQDLLNPMGVNCIRPFGVRGIRLWGARTLSSDPSWRYVNVRRLFNFVEESILVGTQWVVFEPNDFDLWARARRTVYGFLLGLWRQGAFLGATPEQAFYVKCDEETNPPESIDEGKLVIEVGIAPVKPAEFVIFHVSQWQGGATTAE